MDPLEHECLKLQHSLVSTVLVFIGGCSLAPSVGAVRVSAHQQRHMKSLISIAHSEDNLNEEEIKTFLTFTLCKYNQFTISLSYKPQHMGKSWTVPNSPSTGPSRSESCTFLE